MFRDKVYDVRSGSATATDASFRKMVPGPAVRRARAVASFVVMLLVAGCNREPSDAELVEQSLIQLDLAGRVSQLVISAVSPTPASLDSISAAIALPARLGGVWIEGGEAASIARLTGSLRSPTGVPVLVGADLQEGVGGLSNAGTELPPVGHLLSSAEEDELSEIAETMAAEATVLGIHLGAISAPAVAGGFPYSLMKRDGEPEALSRLLGDARSAELPLALDLFRAPEGSPLLRWDLARFAAFELPLLEAAREDGAALILTGAVAPALTGDSTPLAASRRFYTALRRDHDWRPPVIADLRDAVEAPPGAVQAITAGADMVIVRGGPEQVVAALMAAVESGALSPERVEAAVRRVLMLKQTRIEPAQAPVSPDSAQAIVAASGEERAQLSRDLVARLTYRRAGEILPGGGSPVIVFDPEQRARSFVGALTGTAGVVELQNGGSVDSTAAALATQLADTTSLVVTALHYGTFAYADSLLAALPDSLQGRARVVRVGFGDDAVADPRRPPLDVFAWGSGRGSQLAAAEMLTPGENGAPAASYAFAPSLRPEEPETLGMDEDRIAGVDRILREALEDSVFTAAAVVVARRGGIALMSGYGEAGEDGGPVDPLTTLFDLASLSKVVGTTSAAASLMETGEIELDGEVRRYIPEFRGENKGDVTIRHLLSHTAGLPPGLQLFYSAASRQEALEQVIEQPLRRAPGVEAEYSDLGMILLAEVVERASESSLDQLLVRRIFAPLGMSSTMYLPPLAFRGNAVPSASNTERPFVLQGVVHDGNAYRLGGLTGHAGLFGTAWDVAVFSQMMLNGGAYGGTRVLTEETVRELTRRQPNAGERALGWDTPAERSSAGRFLSSSSYGHTGYTGTSIWIDPLRELFVVLLTNRTYTEASAEEILDLRIAVHEAAVQAISDRTISRRPGAR